MPRHYELPTEQVEGDETVLNHPAFGQIMVSRVHGRTTLYGTDFVHETYIQLRIKRSEFRLGGSRDWHYARDELIEVNLSEAQWATFVSSFNIGEGVPCTLDRVAGVRMPEIPHMTADTRFKSEIRSRLDKSVKAIKDAEAAVEAAMAKVPKGVREQVLNHLRQAQREVGANVPYIADCFDEHVEKRGEAAKVELHGYINGVMRAMGLQALRDETEPLRLAAPNDGDNS